MGNRSLTPIYCIDAALHVVAERSSVREARSVAMHLEYDWSPEQGFVRGLMADRHLRMPKQDFDFPESMDIKRLTAVGDQQQWEIDWSVRGGWGPEALLDHLAERARTDAALDVLPEADPMVTGWDYRSELGGRWSLRYVATEADTDGSYRVRATLTMLE